MCDSSNTTSIGPENPLSSQTQRSAPITDSRDEWISEVDEESGLVYWWNEITRESITTKIGAPKPSKLLLLSLLLSLLLLSFFK